jgi:hypothetical protein
MMNQLVFQSAQEAFHWSVLVVAADAVHAGLDIVLAQQLLIDVAGVLAALLDQGCLDQDSPNIPGLA